METGTHPITFNGMLAACANSIYQIQKCIGIAANEIPLAEGNGGGFEALREGTKTFTRQSNRQFFRANGC